jgi:hypothetical protein
MAGLHAMIAERLGGDDEATVVVGSRPPADRGCGPACGGLPGVSGQPVAGGFVPGAARRVRRQERHR